MRNSSLTEKNSPHGSEQAARIILGMLGVNGIPLKKHIIHSPLPTAECMASEIV